MLRDTAVLRATVDTMLSIGPSMVLKQMMTEFSWHQAIFIQKISLNFLDYIIHTIELPAHLKIDLIARNNWSLDLFQPKFVQSILAHFILGLIS